MKDYKIVISVTDVGGIYSAEDFEEAKEIAQTECDVTYSRLKGRCTVKVESIEEVNN